MPNIEILSRFNRSMILESIQVSNEMKVERDRRQKLQEVEEQPRRDKVAV